MPLTVAIVGSGGMGGDVLSKLITRGLRANLRGDRSGLSGILEVAQVVIPPTIGHGANPR